jgi:hypothetical protein
MRWWRTKVMFRQRPCGILAFDALTARRHPRSGAILVLVHVVACEQTSAGSFLFRCGLVHNV